MNTCDSVIHLPGSVFPCALPEVRQHVADALHIGDRLLELVHRRGRRVHVRIDQSRQHGLAAKIDPLCARLGKLQHVSVCPGRQDAAVANRHRFDDVKLRIDGDNLAVVDDVARRRLRRLAGQSAITTSATSMQVRMKFMSDLRHGAKRTPQQNTTTSQRTTHKNSHR